MNLVHPGKRDFTLTKAELERHLLFFAKANLDVVSMRQALAILSKGSPPERPCVCMTFDDGYEEDFTVSHKAIRSHGYSAHFFLVPDFLGKTFSNTLGSTDFPRRYLSSEQVQALVSEGSSIGSHGDTHAILTDLNREQALEEMRVSRARLETLSGTPVTTLSFPSGRYNSYVLDSASGCGYEHTFKVGVGVSTRIHTAIPYARTLIRGHDLSQHFQAISSRGHLRGLLAKAKRLLLHGTLR